eukprot:2786820-Prymnesium_polylepis.1
MTTILELALILIYVCVLIIKICDQSERACETFGFGTTGSGTLSCLLVLHLLRTRAPSSSYHCLCPQNLPHRAGAQASACGFGARDFSLEDGQTSSCSQVS